jgi:O-antigen ligase
VPARSRRSTAWRGPISSRAGQAHSAFLHVLSGTGLLGAIPAAIALAAAVACTGGHAAARIERSAALPLAAGVGAFALHNQIDWEWRFALTLLRITRSPAIACRAGTGSAVVARPPGRRGARRRSLGARRDSRRASGAE